MHTLYNLDNYFPSTIWIDHEMRVYSKMNNAGSWSINSRIEDMLENCGTLCEGCSGDIDTDGDGLADECDDCLNLSGDINDDMIIDILDLVSVVNIILNVTTNAPDCQLSDADLQNDGEINILDIVLIINMILSN